MCGRRLNDISHSLIVQKDNALSMRTNTTLRTISEDQKWIALAAIRDSATMRRAKLSGESCLITDKQFIAPRRTLEMSRATFVPLPHWFIYVQYKWRGVYRSSLQAPCR
jgi:hypothetical protein